jgi:hypothetical protein
LNYLPVNHISLTRQFIPMAQMSIWKISSRGRLTFPGYMVNIGAS